MSVTCTQILDAYFFFSLMELEFFLRTSLGQPEWAQSHMHTVGIQPSSALYFLLAVDIRWLGVHHADLFGADSRVPDSALQQWASSDERVHKGVVAVVEKMVRQSSLHSDIHSFSP